MAIPSTPPASTPETVAPLDFNRALFVQVEVLQQTGYDLALLGWLAAITQAGISVVAFYDDSPDRSQFEDSPVASLAESRVTGEFGWGRSGYARSRSQPSTINTIDQAQRALESVGFPADVQITSFTGLKRATKNKAVVIGREKNMGGVGMFFNITTVRAMGDGLLRSIGNHFDLPAAIKPVPVSAGALDQLRASALARGRG